MQGLIESFLDQVQTSGEKIVKTHFNVMLFDPSLKDLKQHKSETASAFSMMNCFPYQHTHDLPMLFFFLCPFLHPATGNRAFYYPGSAGLLPDQL